METEIINSGTQIINSGTQVIGDKTSDLYKNFTGGLLQKGECVGGWAVESKMNVASGEADIYIGEKDGQKRVIKYYRGDRPKEKVLEILKGINHPNIIKIFDYGMYKGHFFEIMEYCAGGAVDSRDDEGNYKFLPLDEPAVLEICRQMVEGFKVIHENKIIQRDVKPSNIYFSDEGRKNIMIADFGISSVINEEETVSHKTKTESRTTGYCAPEVLSGFISPKMDYYSLGITLWELATGKDPFVMENGKRRNDAHLIRDTIEGLIADDLLSREPFLSKNMEHLIRGLLVINDRKRWGYNEVIRHLNGEDVEIAKNDKKVWNYDIGGVNCTTLEALGTAIADNMDEAGRDIYRGIFSGYFQNIYPDIVKQVDEIIDEYSAKNKQNEGLLKIVWLLNPEYPLTTENGYKIENKDDIINMIINAPEEMLPLISDFNSQFYIYLEHLGLGDKIGEIKHAVKNIGSVYGWHIMEHIYWVAIILKDKVVKPFKLERYKDFELSELSQLEKIPKDLREYALLLIKEHCLDGLFLPWLTLLGPKNCNWDDVQSWDDLMNIIK